ncbi:ArnT family glycosyltransferase [Haloarcula salina]|uniref:Glycosyltransferase family 39 protein n=1 Tax=Haloarcula salina TaxID=1429914 RepID=A0AA41KIJ5_9EURY|nr:glycosyltransferase family 39 protein [Haloarcula salina]MBV0901748.1 glycosyltransferase family 39 protein [Haloarcula salina]
MSNPKIEQIVQRTGLTRESGETGRQYLRRIGDEHDIEDERVEEAISRVAKEFDPQAEWTSADEEAVTQFIDAIETERAADTPNSKSRETQSPTKRAKTGKTATDDFLAQRSASITEGGNRTQWFNKERLPWPDTTIFREQERIETVDYGIIAALVALGLYVFVYNIGVEPLTRWDESIYANVARNMVVNGDWLVPHLYIHPQKPGVRYQPFLEKPPLVFWLQGISMSVFGVTRFAARLPVGLFGVLSGVVVYRFGAVLRDRLAGVVATSVLLTTPIIVLRDHGGRTASTDVPLLFFGTLFLYLTWRALTEDRPSLLPFVGVVAGLALLTKSFNAGIFVIASAPLALSRVKMFLSRDSAKMVGLTVAVVLPWPVYAWSQYGDEFLYQIFLQQVLQRATGESFATSSGTLFEFMRYPYFAEFPEFFGPWTYLLLPAAAGTVLSGKRSGRTAGPLLLIWWATTTLGFFAVTGNHSWYIMSMFVPCALLIGLAVSDAASGSVLAGAGLGIGLITLLAMTGVSVAGLILSIGLATVVCFPYYVDLAEPERTTGDWQVERVTVALLVSVLLIATVVGTPPAGNSQPQFTDTEELGRTANEVTPPGATIAIVPRFGKIWTFTFFADRNYEGVTPAELATEPGGTYALVANETLERSGREYTILHAGTEMRLVRLDTPSKQQRTARPSRVTGYRTLTG